MTREFRESQGLARCLLQVRETRLLPMTWQDQNADESRALLVTFMQQETLPTEVLVMIVGFCHVDDVLILGASVVGYPIPTMFLSVVQG